MEPLMEREKEIAILAAQGRSNHEIAQELCIAEQTVKNALTVIFEKVGVRNRTELAMFVARMGWMDAGAENK